MAEVSEVPGMVLSSMDISEYDKRLVILTSSLGKVTAFARGARRQTSRFLGASQPMAFGKFMLYRGRNSYSLDNANISNYFGNEIKDVDSLYTGMYFLELADYFTKEGLEGTDILKLLFFSMKYISNPNANLELARCIFELKMLVLNGIYPDFFTCINCGSDKELVAFDNARKGMVCKKCLKSQKTLDSSTIYALQYIVASDLEHLYSFNVLPNVLEELKKIVYPYTNAHTDKKFNSLDFL